MPDLLLIDALVVPLRLSLAWALFLFVNVEAFGSRLSLCLFRRNDLTKGLVLTWALLALINVNAFGSRLPVHLFPRDCLRLRTIALATLLPAWRLSRTPPAQPSGVFPHEP